MKVKKNQSQLSGFYQSAEKNKKCPRMEAVSHTSIVGWDENFPRIEAVSRGVLSDRMITWTVMGNLTLKIQSLHVLGHSTQLVEQRRKMWFLYTTMFSLMYYLNTSRASISQGHQLSPNNALALV